MSEVESREEFSAGGVVYKKKNNEVKWLVCKHSGYHKWGMPKGLIEEGESLEEAAVREVEEESGVKVKIIDKVGDPEKYEYIMNGAKVSKQVDYFLMEYMSGDISDHDWEMEEVEWLSYDQAYQRLAFEGAKKVLERAKTILGVREVS